MQAKSDKSVVVTFLTLIKLDVVTLRIAIIF